MAARPKPIQYQWSNLRADVVGPGNGLTTAELDARGDNAKQAVQHFLARVEQGEIGFPSLPQQKKPVAQVNRFARKWKGKCRHVLLLGIGGSSLGAVALDAVVNGAPPFRRKDAPAELITVDNADPMMLGRALDRLDPKKTVALVITKSGSTAETMAQFLIVYDWLQKKLGKKAAARHVAAVTDANKGDLLKIAREEGIETFAVPANVGGRFSALTPVGLLPAALLGVNIPKLLSGAADITRACSRLDPDRNPALGSALHQFVLDTRYGRNIQVIYVYSQQLWPLAFWYRQLWAESLGKRLDRSRQEVWTGQTPVVALGVTDQHSQSQLYMEGPPDKTITFWEVGQHSPTVRIPRLFKKLESTGYLGGKTLTDLFRAEKIATEMALVEADRPNATFLFPKADEYYAGQMMMLLEFQAAYAGELYGVNAFDQPGVELGKQLTYALMGRAGYGPERKRLSDFQKQKNGKSGRKKR